MVKSGDLGWDVVLKDSGRGVSGRRSKDFITGRKQKKITAGGRGVSGRRSRDFITGRPSKKKK